MSQSQNRLPRKSNSSPINFLKLITTLLLVLCLLCGCSANNSQQTSALSDTEAVFATNDTLAQSDFSTNETDNFTETVSETLPYEETDEDDAIILSQSQQSSTATTAFSLDIVSAYTDSPYLVINDNVPYFTEDELSTVSFEYYSDLDELGRCGVCYANVGTDIMPTESRGNIGSVKPTGWHTVKYDIVDGNYLYNRCHLIGYQLTGENANEKNLITGTRYLNVNGMLPFENMIADYVKETDNHVLYRVTPIFDGDNLVASGVLMEAFSVEDNGEGVMFCVYCYNVQPGITIDYATGDSQLNDSASDTTSDKTTSGSSSSNSSSLGTETTDTSTSSNTTTNSDNASDDDSNDSSSDVTYIVNTNTMKFHTPSCSSAATINESNRWDYTGDRQTLIDQGYEPCKRCNP